MEYWAFISYSHKNRPWGDWLHRRLETFVVPQALVHTPGRDGEPLPARLFPIFRDREELPTSADLGQIIDDALRQSRYLIVICSPQSASSRWVNEEILRYQRLGRENRILALIVDGEPNAGEGKEGFSADRECFPAALKRSLAGQPVEPIAADARPQGDGRHDALLKIVAGLLGVRFDALKKREELRQRRRRRILATLVGALLLIFAGLTVAALWQRQVAVAQRREADVQRQKAETALADARRALAESLLATARDHVERDELAEAAVLFAQANLLHPTDYAADNARALLARLPSLAHLWPAAKPPALPTFTAVSNPSAQSGAAVSRLAVEAEDWWHFNEPMPRALIDQGDVMRAAALSPDHRLLCTGGQNGILRLWDAQTLAPVGSPMDEKAMANTIAFSPDGTHVLAGDSEGDLALWDVKTCAMAYRVHFPGCSAVKFSADGKFFIAGSHTGNTLRRWDTQSGVAIGAPIPQPDGVACLDLSRDGKQVLVGMEGDKTALLWDLADAATPRKKLDFDDLIVAVALAPDASRCVLSGIRSMKSFSLRDDSSWSADLAETALAAGFDPAGLRLYASGPGNQVHARDAATGQPVGQFGTTGRPEIWYAHDPTSLLLGDNALSLLMDWKMPALTAGATIPLPDKDDPVTLSQDGRLLAVADGLNVNVYEPLSGRKIAGTTLAVGTPFDLRFTGADAAQRLEIFHGIAGGLEVRSLDPATGGLVVVRSVHAPMQNILARTDDFTRVVIQVKDAPANRLSLLRVAPDAQPLNIDFPGTPGQAMLASGAVIHHTGQPLTWRFSGDGRRIVVGTADLRIRVLDCDTGKILREINPADRHIRRVGISDQGDLVAVQTDDLAVRVFEADAGTLRGPVIKVAGEVADFQFTPDGHYLFVHLDYGPSLAADLLTPANPLRQMPRNCTLSSRHVAGMQGSRIGADSIFHVRDTHPGGDTVGLGLTDVASGLPLGTLWETDGEIVASAGDVVVLRQGPTCRVWNLAPPAPPESPQALLRRAAVQTGLEVVDQSRVERLSPARWEALRASANP